jgi:hypothetical protein
MHTAIESPRIATPWRPGEADDYNDMPASKEEQSAE